MSRLASIKKKSAFKNLNIKQKVPVNDYEIEKILKGVLERQDMESQNEKYRRKSLSKTEILSSTRDERKLKRYEDIMGVWKADSERISKRVKRTVKESVFARCDIFRRK